MTDEGQTRPTREPAKLRLEPFSLIPSRPFGHDSRAASRLARAAQLVAAVLFVSGCPQIDTVAIRNLTTPGTTIPGTRCTLDCPMGDRCLDDGCVSTEAFCEGTGPIITVSDGAVSRCTSDLARRTFRYAMCICNDLVTGQPITTDAFDSTQGPFTLPESAGALGINGNANIQADLDVGGSLWVGGAQGLVTGAAPVTVTGDLQVAGTIASNGSVTVARNAYVGGRLRARNLTVQNDLTLPEGAALDVSGTTQIGAEVRAPVTVDAPCSCDADTLFDVAAEVARHRSDNDNATIDLSEDALANRTGSMTLSLPCGLYYLSRIGGAGALTIEAQGRVALFIDGDVSLQDRFSIVLSPGAEVDLLIAGNLVSDAPLDLGSADAPAKVRLYIGGAGTIQIAENTLLGGNLYAPRAELVTGGAVEAFGSLFVRRINAGAGLTVHYDTAVLTDLPEACQPPSQAMCTSCLDCPGQGCNRGQCGACSGDSDCCSPLVCQGSACIPNAL